MCIGVGSGNCRLACGKVQSNWLALSRKGNFVSLWRSVVLTEEYNVTVNSAELIGTTEYLTI